MKKKLFQVLTAAAITTAAFTSTARAAVYPEAFRVWCVDRERGVTWLETSTGNVFTILDTDDWQVGDMAAAIMDDNGTSDIRDDAILDLKYTGF